MIKDYFLNPVKIVTDKVQLIAAISILILSISLCFFMDIGQDGIYHAIYLPNQSTLFLVTSNILVVLIPAVLLFIAGKYINKGTRLLDLWNTILFSRLTLMVGYAIYFGMADKTILEKINSGSLALTNIPKEELMKISFTGFWVLPFLIYSIILLVNGFKTSVYAKKPFHYILMALSIIASELVYRVIMFPVLGKL